MKKYILPTAFILLSTIALSQNTNLDYKKALKVYNLTTYNEEVSVEPLDTNTVEFLHTTSSSLKILHPTFAYQWAAGNSNFHEVELTYLMLEKESTKTELVKGDPNKGTQISKGEWIHTSLSVQYEYILNLYKSAERKLVPALGFGINPYYKRYNYIPELTTEFSTTQTYLGTKVYFTPRLNYFFSEKLFLDLNIPIALMDIYYKTDKKDDPTLERHARTSNSLSYESFPKIFTARIGIGIKI